MKIKVRREKEVYELRPAQRGYSVWEESDGTLWLLDLTGFAYKIKGTEIVAEVME